MEATAPCNECSETLSVDLLDRVSIVRREKYVGTVCPDISLLDDNGTPIRFIEVVDSHSPERNVHEYALANGIDVFELHLRAPREFIGTRKNRALDASLAIKARLQEIADGEIRVDTHTLLCQRPKCDECGGRLPLRTIAINTKDCWKCGQAVNVAVGSKDDHNLEPGSFTEEEIAFARSNGVILERRFSAMVMAKYLANVCPHCDQIQGNWFLYMDPFHDRYNIHRTSREAYGPCDACATFFCRTHWEYIDYGKAGQCPACLEEAARVMCPNNPSRECFVPDKCEATGCYFVNRERPRAG